MAKKIKKSIKNFNRKLFSDKNADSETLKSKSYTNNFSTFLWILFLFHFSKNTKKNSRENEIKNQN